MADEFKKIDLEKSPKPPVPVKKRSLRITLPKKKVLIFLLFLAVFLTGIFLPIAIVYGRVSETVKEAKVAYHAFKNQDIEEAKKGVEKTKQALETTSNSYKLLIWAKFIPFIGSYYRDGERVINAGLYGLEAAQQAIVAISPYADLLGFKGDSPFVEKSTDERIQTAVLAFEKVTPELAKIGEKLKKVREQIAPIDPNRYPQKIGQIEIGGRVESFKELAGQYLSMFIDAQPLLEVLPRLLGQPDPVTYLVLFQNDKELRPTGGFITAYAIFKVNQGKMEVVRSDDIYRLDESKTKRVGAPPEILKYHKGVYYFNLRDSNLSPDFAKSMEQFEELYGLIAGKTEIDGIIAVDTHVLVEILKVLGPINLAGREFSSEEDPRCECPKVVYELEDYATRPVGYLRTERKDIIGSLLYEIMQKALGVSPGEYWARLFQVGLGEFSQKHILAYFHEEKAQVGIEALNFAGRIKDFEGDYLHINDTNFAGAKSNMFTKHFVAQEIKIEDEGDVIKTITIDYKNPAPPSNCDLESGELCLNGLLRNWLRIYVPQGSELLEFKGSEMDVVVSQDLGKTVFEGFLVVKPLGSAQVVVQYRLPFKVKKGEEYPLLIQKQPGTEGHEYKVLVNGEEVEKFNLITDRELKFKL